ncbi:stage II sporulation protein R [Virgibacillus necropolis]|uniref:Stage II sporulation protein R n=1 Tax=Virgibacillus necropolis TaxID=163877 RepID=A0A221M8T1_9BACI|nr:stage II sporulation protein R [Virgibacillus necropolis]ASN04053.1 stage II sporulation protein R [Virgibacillus necropolis]
MKKIIFFVLIFFIIFLSMPINGASKSINDKMGYQVIPDEAIRLRILANSNGDRDQEVKRSVRDAVNASISKWVKDITDINEARELIQARLPEIKKIVADTLKEADKEQVFDVKYGPNVSFPTKLYGSYIYPAGEYEAVLITLGEGKGANWWCVLFPPLCFLDFANGTSVATVKASEVEPTEEEEKPVEAKFFLFEWLGLS